MKTFNYEIMQESFEMDVLEEHKNGFVNVKSCYQIGFDYDTKDNFYTLFVVAYGGSLLNGVYTSVSKVEVLDDLSLVIDETSIDERTNALSEEIHDKVISDTLELVNKTLYNGLEHMCRVFNKF